MSHHLVARLRSQGGMISLPMGWYSAHSAPRQVQAIKNTAPGLKVGGPPSKQTAWTSSSSPIVMSTGCRWTS